MARPTGRLGIQATRVERFDKFNRPKEDEKDKQFISDELCGDRRRPLVKRDSGQAAASERAGGRSAGD